MTRPTVSNDDGNTPKTEDTHQPMFTPPTSQEAVESENEDLFITPKTPCYESSFDESIRTGLPPLLQPASKLFYLGEWNESRENARASGEAKRGRGKESLQRSLIKFHLYFAQTKGNTIGSKMTGSDWYRKLVSALKADGLVWCNSRKENIASRGQVGPSL